MNRLFPVCAALVLPLMLAWLAGCSAAPDEEGNAIGKSQIAVTTAAPVRQTFHDTVEALGSAVGDPHHARAISLGRAHRTGDEQD